MDTTTTPAFRAASERADRRWGRALVLGLSGAVLIHLAALLLFRTTRVLPPPFSAAGPRMGDVRAARGGGGGMTAVEVRERRAPPPAEAPQPVPTPVPVPVPEEVVVRPERPPAPETGQDAVSAPLAGTGETGAGGQAGAETGPGTATGTGRGGGGTEEEGASGLVAPRPRGLLIPPTGRPASARGQEITVWVFVGPTGRVLADSTRLEPPTSDARYNRKLRQSVAEWVFEPARRDGRPVGAWYPFEIIL